MKIDAIYLRACVAAYLRYRRRCPLISFERAKEYWDNPDVLGLTKGRQWIEVEIKCSLSDLRADAKKRKWLLGVSNRRQFYYCVPPDLVEKALPKIPDGRGLMTLADTSIYGLRIIKVMRGAVVHRDATRATTREIVEAVWHQSGTLCGLAKDAALKRNER